MDEPNEELRVIPELYFLIAKFLSGGPLKETAKTLLKELERVEVLPRRLDWEGNEHAQSYDELAAQYTEIPYTRLSSVCERALRLARLAPSLALPPPPPPSPPAITSATSCQPSSSQPSSSTAEEQILKLTARLSLLSETLVRPKPKYATHIPDHTLVRRLVSRELGSGPAAAPGGRGGVSMFPARMLSGLQLQRRTLGHLSAVYCLVFDCTGRYVITGADDLLVKVWSAVDGRLLATLRGAGAEITDVCVSADSALLAAGSVERLVRVWCLATGAPRAVLAAHAGTITSVHWAPPAHTDLRLLASTSTDGSVAFWTCSSDGQFLSQPVQYVERMRPGACHMICAAWSAGGAFLAAGSADHHVRLYSVEREAGAPRRVLEVAVHSDAVDSIAWAHQGLKFVSGSKDGSAALWTLHATQWRHVILLPPAIDNGNTDGKRLKVTMVCWDCSDAFVMTAVSDWSVRVWCARTARQLRTLTGHSDEAYVLEPHPFLPAVLLSAGHDGQLFVWDAQRGEVIAHFHNRIEGQGSGAIFDAKWGGGAHLAASDSHGHLLLLGLGAGHRRLQLLPPELFFHTDYRPLARDALGGALDEQTETPPHLMPPPFLVDVEGAPHAPELQRLVPGRENLALAQLIPAASAAGSASRSRLDAMILALAAGERTPPGAGGGGGGGPWRGEGVRHTAGSWQQGDPLLVPHSTRPIVSPQPAAAREHTERASCELNAMEMSWWRREMRRRPVMITTCGAATGPRRRPGRRARPAAPRPAPARPAARPAPRLLQTQLAGTGTDSGSETSDESIRLSPSVHSSGEHSQGTSIDFTDSSSSSSSQYSDWEAGAALAPPARARRRPLPMNRYSPSTSAAKRSVAAAGAGPGAGPGAGQAAGAGEGSGAGAEPEELPEAYRPGEWLTAVVPRKAPYHPQMGDECLYFRLGHQRYFEAVAEKDLYKINPRDKPWERTFVDECEQVKVVGIKYVIKPPRVVCLRLACSVPTGARPRSFTVRYHDMADVIDFLVLKHQYEAGVGRQWSAGDRFRCMIDDSWWAGTVLERAGAVPPPAPPPLAADWDPARAAREFLSLKVRWDNGEVERLSPWDLEPLDPARLPAEPGGSVPVLPAELHAALYRPAASEWPPRGSRAAAARAIAHHVSQVMSLSVAEPFVAPVDLQLYPSYARIVPYPIDLSTIRARFENMFYRRMAAAQFDVRYLASNAEQYNESHSPIVRQARLVTDLLLHIISHWRDVDVVGKYHELCASYHSTDEDTRLHTKSGRRVNRRPRSGSSPRPRRSAADWRTVCRGVLDELLASADSEPFRQPVAPEMAPDYRAVISQPMDLGTVGDQLANEHYSSADRFAADVRRVFANSRHYNTNKRSRIYSMTVRLSALFEALWSRVQVTRRPERRTKRPRRATRQRENYIAGAAPLAAGAAPPSPGRSDSCESEPLAATSRRVHAAAAARAALTRDDSWDSDAPLAPANKGKGIGKKSKSSSNSTEPTASTSRPRPHMSYSSSPSRANGVPPGAGRRGTPGSSASDRYTNMEVLEEEDGELTYTEPDRLHEPRKRPRPLLSSVSASSEEWVANRPRSKRRKRKHQHKRPREHLTRGSWSSSSSSASASLSPRRYESDRSYRPRYSSDDDAPLQLIRERQQTGSDSQEAGPRQLQRQRPSTSQRSGGVSLRARRSPRQYNEDSEEDSAAAISKRLQHHHRHNHLDNRRQRHAQQSLSLASSAMNNDHNYFNGHSSPPPAPRPRVYRPAPANNNNNNNNTDGHSMHNGASTSGSNTPPVSISSRGRVRKLTAKARGLLRD